MIPQQPLLDVTQVHGLPVDEDEPHAALEAASRVLAVRGGAAWTERTEGLHAAKLTLLCTIGLLTKTCLVLLRQVVAVVFRRCLNCVSMLAKKTLLLHLFLLLFTHNV